MKYNSEIHKRKSIRLKGYDYSQAGLYFITICVQNRDDLFGMIENGEMKLNDAGQMIVKWYYELINKFPDIKCDEMIVMPNHFHCIVENVGADLRVCTNNIEQTYRDATILGEHKGSPLSTVVQWFKTMTTNEYIRGVKNLGWQPFNGKLWQRNYYEHIIRNEKSYQTISKYIINNPAQWQADTFHQR
jgi:putative transposase